MRNILISIIFILFSSFSYASTPCKAINGEAIVDLSDEICMEDKSFLVFYETFPSLFDDYYFKLFPESSLKDISKVSEVRNNIQTQANENMIVGTFKAVLNMSYLIVLFFMFYNAFYSLLKGASRGTFLLDTGVSSKSIISMYFIGAFLLIPVGDIAIIHIFIIAFIMIGISMANYVYGFFLADIQQKNYLEVVENQTTIQEPKDIILTHNGSAGVRYASALTKMALCREITTQYLMDSKQSNLDSSNYGEKKSCAAGTLSVGVANTRLQAMGIASNLDQYPNFINHQLTYIDKSLSKTIVASSEIRFGVITPKNCPMPEQHLYECGRMRTITPILDDYPIVDIVGRDFFMITVQSVLSNVPLNGGAADTIHKGWKTIYDMLMQKLMTEIDNEKDPEKKKLALSIIEDKETKDIKALSYIYHQYILNGMTTGLIVHSYNSNNSVDLVKKGNSATSGVFINPIINDFNRVNKIAKKIQQQNCLYKAKSINKQELYVSKTNGNPNAMGSAACVDIDSKEVYSMFNGTIADIRDKGVVDKITSLQDEALTGIKDFAREVANRRTDVEDSFNRSLKEYDRGVAYANLRREGWLMLPYYNFVLIKDVKMNERYIRSLISSNQFDLVNTQHTYISDDLYQQIGSAHNYNDFSGQTNVFASVPNPKTSEYYTDHYQKALGLLEDSQEEMQRGKSFTEVFFDAMFYNPIRGLKDATGMNNNGGELTDDDYSNMNDCLTNIDYCLIPKHDPITALQEYGQKLISQGMVGLSIIAASKALSFQKNLNTPEWKEKNNKNETKTARNYNTAISKSGSVIGNFFSTISSIVSILSAVILLLIVCGIFLAYIFPLLPIMFFTIAFLSYFIIAFQVLMISPLLAANFVRYNEEKAMIVKALKVYVLTIIFKPVLLVVAYICMYAMFKVVFFFINMSIVNLLTAMDSNTNLGIVSMFQSIMFIAIYISAIIFGITFIMKGFNSLTNIMLKAIDAGETDNDVSGMSDTMKGAIAVWGAEKLTGAAENVSGQYAERGIDKIAGFSSIIDKLAKKKTKKEGSNEEGTKEDNKEDKK